MRNLFYQSQHTLIALAVCLLAIPFPSQRVAIFAGICCFFVSREIAQAEYKFIQRYCRGKRDLMPPFAWVNPLVWDVHSFIWNMTAPIAVSAGVIFYALGQ